MSNGNLTPTTNQKPISQDLIRIPLNNNELLEKVLQEVNNSVEVKTLWKVININAIDRLGMPDHGSVHSQIVANIALRLLRILEKKGIQMSITKNYKLSGKYAELVVLLASLFHDLGMSICRENHEEYSLFLVDDLLSKLLAFLSLEEQIIVRSEIMHAIISHRSDGRPITIEGGVVRVADALDMSQGRSRIPFEAGHVDIYSISAYAIDNIEIEEGERKPIRINVYMNNSSGIFQVDELLKSKLANSGISQYIHVKAFVKGDTEKRILKDFDLES